MPDGSTLSEIETALRRRSAWAFAPGLEAPYRAWSVAAIRRGLWPVLVWVGVLTVLSSGLDALLSRAILVTAWPWRLVVGALFLGGAALMRGRGPFWLAQLGAAVPVLGLMAMMELVGCAGPAAMRDRYVLSSILFFGLLMVGLPSTLPLCVGMCAAAAVLYPLVLLLGAPYLAPDIPAYAVVGFGVCATCVLVAMRTEVLRRRSFLERRRYEAAAAELNLMNAQLLRASTTDVLTGLANRRHFETEGARLWAGRPGQGFGAVLIDIDYFKRFNDAAGHVAGDACLRAVAQAVAAALRKSDCRVARYGGEEFASIVPDVGREELGRLGERLRAAVEELDLPHPGLPGRRVSVSIGLAWCGRPGAGQSVETLLMEADRALYRAKAMGRDRVSWDLAEPAPAQG